MLLVTDLALLATASLLRGAFGASRSGIPNDLQTFVSRPDIIAPLFQVKTYDFQYVSPGYWFFSLYRDVINPDFTLAEQPRNVGPYVYDTYGNLVWSGASLFRRRAIFNFKPSTFNGSQHLSLIMAQATEAHSQPTIYGAEGENKTFPGGVELFLDTSYGVHWHVPTNKNWSRAFNMHEFNIVDGGERALRITGRLQYWELRDDDGGTIEEEGMLVSNGFQEVDTTTGEVIFEWDSLSHILPTASYLSKPPRWGGKGADKEIWDYFHMNSVDKDSAGDYLISSRYTYTIYKISHLTGSIIWSLGGKTSSFSLLPKHSFNFSHQYHARFQDENKVTNITLVSFLNNAADYYSSTAEYSSAFLVALNMTDMTAALVSHWDRPDRDLTKAKGNVQILDDPTSRNSVKWTNGSAAGGNIFVGWASDNYLSEFTASGVCVQEARFSSPRYGTYRIYKYNFVATPKIKDIAIKAYSHREMKGGISVISSTVYVSWNGATEVDEWKIYNAQSGYGNGGERDWNFIGSVKKTGFETVYTSDVHLAFVYAQALDSKGRELGNSSVWLTIPRSWDCGDENCGDPSTDKIMILESLSGDPIRPLKKVSPNRTTVAIGNYLIVISLPTLIFGSALLFLLSLFLLSMAAFGVYYFLRNWWPTVAFNFSYTIVPTRD